MTEEVGAGYLQALPPKSLPSLEKVNTSGPLTLDKEESSEPVYLDELTDSAAALHADKGPLSLNRKTSVSPQSEDRTASFRRRSSSDRSPTSDTAMPVFHMEGADRRQAELEEPQLAREASHSDDQRPLESAKTPDVSLMAAHTHPPRLELAVAEGSERRDDVDDDEDVEGLPLPTLEPEHVPHAEEAVGKEKEEEKEEKEEEEEKEKEEKEEEEEEKEKEGSAAESLTSTETPRATPLNACEDCPANQTADSYSSAFLRYFSDRKAVPGSGSISLTAGVESIFRKRPVVVLERLSPDVIDRHRPSLPASRPKTQSGTCAEVTATATAGDASLDGAKQESGFGGELSQARVKTSKKEKTTPLNETREWSKVLSGNALVTDDSLPLHSTSADTVPLSVSVDVKSSSSSSGPGHGLNSCVLVDPKVASLSKTLHLACSNGKNADQIAFKQRRPLALSGPLAPGSRSSGPTHPAVKHAPPSTLEKLRKQLKIPGQHRRKGHHTAHTAHIAYTAHSQSALKMCFVPRETSSPLSGHRKGRDRTGTRHGTITPCKEPAVDGWESRPDVIFDCGSPDELALSQNENGAAEVPTLKVQRNKRYSRTQKLTSAGSVGAKNLPSHHSSSSSPPAWTGQPPYSCSPLARTVESGSNSRAVSSSAVGEVCSTLSPHARATAAASENNADEHAAPRNAAESSLSIVPSTTHSLTTQPPSKLAPSPADERGGRKKTPAASRSASDEMMRRGSEDPESWPRRAQARDSSWSSARAGERMKASSSDTPSVQAIPPARTARADPRSSGRAKSPTPSKETACLGSQSAPLSPTSSNTNGANSSSICVEAIHRSQPQSFQHAGVIVAEKAAHRNDRSLPQARAPSVQQSKLFHDRVNERSHSAAHRQLQTRAEPEETEPLSQVHAAGVKATAGLDISVSSASGADSGCVIACIEKTSPAFVIPYQEEKVSVESDMVVMQNHYGRLRSAHEDGEAVVVVSGCCQHPDNHHDRNDDDDDDDDATAAGDSSVDVGGAPTKASSAACCSLAVPLTVQVSEATDLPRPGHCLSNQSHLANAGILMINASATACRAVSPKVSPGRHRSVSERNDEPSSAAYRDVELSTVLVKVDRLLTPLPASQASGPDVETDQQHPATHPRVQEHDVSGDQQPSAASPEQLQQNDWISGTLDVVEEQVLTSEQEVTDDAREVTEDGTADRPFLMYLPDLEEQIVGEVEISQGEDDEADEVFEIVNERDVPIPDEAFLQSLNLLREPGLQDHGCDPVSPSKTDVAGIGAMKRGSGDEGGGGLEGYDSDATLPYPREELEAKAKKKTRRSKTHKSRKRRHSKTPKKSKPPSPLLSPAPSDSGRKNYPKRSRQAPSIKVIDPPLPAPKGKQVDKKKSPKKGTQRHPLFKKRNQVAAKRPKARANVSESDSRRQQPALKSPASANSHTSAGPAASSARGVEATLVFSKTSAAESDSGSSSPLESFSNDPFSSSSKSPQAFGASSLTKTNLAKLCQQRRSTIAIDSIPEAPESRPASKGKGSRKGRRKRKRPRDPVRKTSSASEKPLAVPGTTEEDSGKAQFSPLALSSTLGCCCCVSIVF